MARDSEKKRKEIRDGFTHAINKFGGNIGVNANKKKTPRDPNLESTDKSRSLKKKKNLKNGLDVHWRTDADGYEYILRTIFDHPKWNTMSDAERSIWLTRGWQQRLEQRRNRHRKEGISDALFIHPSLLKKDK